MDKKVEAYMPQLKKLGFELLDLGTDFCSSEHLYYLLPLGSHTPMSNCILKSEGIELMLQDMKK